MGKLTDWPNGYGNVLPNGKPPLPNNANTYISSIQTQTKITNSFDILQVIVSSLSLCLLIAVIIWRRSLLHSFLPYLFALLGRVKIMYHMRKRGLVDSEETAYYPAGITNPASLCYVNSSLQALSSLQYYPALLFQILPNPVEESYAADLLELFRKINSPARNRPLTWSWRLHTLIGTTFIQQQDAQEYLLKVFGEIDEELGTWIKERPEQYKKLLHAKNDKEYRKFLEEYKISSPNPIQGSKSAEQTCLTCGFTRNAALEHFFIQDLDVPEVNGSERGSFYIVDALLKLTNPTILSGVHCANCTVLKLRADTIKQIAQSLYGTESPGSQQDAETLQEALRKYDHALHNQDILRDDSWDDKLGIRSAQMVGSDISKTIRFAKAPYSLVIQLKRYSWDNYMGAVKNNRPVIFEEYLDLDPFHDHKSQHELSIKYRLRSIITHIGTHDNGHYVCYKYCPRRPAVEGSGRSISVPEGWYCMDDDLVRPQTLEEVLGKSDAYMLFYEMVPEYDYQIWIASRTPLPDQTADEIFLLSDRRLSGASIGGAQASDSVDGANTLTENTDVPPQNTWSTSSDTSYERISTPSTDVGERDILTSSTELDADQLP